MLLAVLLVGVVLIVVAVKGSQDTLFAALKEDVPHFGVWAAAILALGAIGFVPGLKPISRGLLALVIVVIIINNYQQILAGLKDGFTPGSSGGGGSGTTGTTSTGQVADLIKQGASLSEAFGGFGG